MIEIRCIGILRQTIFDGFNTLSTICDCAPMEVVKRGEGEIDDFYVFTCTRPHLATNLYFSAPEHVDTGACNPPRTSRSRD